MVRNIKELYQSTEQVSVEDRYLSSIGRFAV
jgi:hypothetical protein